MSQETEFFVVTAVRASNPTGEGDTGCKLEKNTTCYHEPIPHTRNLMKIPNVT
jgi:hypothetical protein